MLEPNTAYKSTHMCVQVGLFGYTSFPALSIPLSTTGTKTVVTVLFLNWSFLSVETLSIQFFTLFIARLLAL